MSSRVQCVWISWRIQWPSSVDTVTVRSVLQAAGIKRIRWESTAALSADRPSVQDLLWGKTPCWLKWWRNWRRPNYLMTVTLELEMCSVTSVLEENTKPSSPVWCVWNHIVKLIWTVMKNFIHVSHTKWLKPLDDCRRWSARNMRSSLRFSVALIRSVYVCCVWRMIIKTTTLYQLQHRSQRNRYLKRHTNKILLILRTVFNAEVFNPVPGDPLSWRVYLQPYSNTPDVANQAPQDCLKIAGRCAEAGWK